MVELPDARPERCTRKPDDEPTFAVHVHRSNATNFTSAFRRRVFREMRPSPPDGTRPGDFELMAKLRRLPVTRADIAAVQAAAMDRPGRAAQPVRERQASRVERVPITVRRAPLPGSSRISSNGSTNY
ncbi:MAG: hypothetical protein ACOY45_07300 [Pseudomonadota bacterium]